MMTAVIEELDPRQPEVEELLNELNAYLLGLYPPCTCHLMNCDRLAEPHVTFWAARLGERLVGCGALRRLDERTGEVKRMYVRPEARGHSLGRRLLETIEERARGLGMSELKLETGPKQGEAMALYRSSGFELCEAFGEYQPDPEKYFMVKAL